MDPYPPYSGRRSVTESGNSVVVSLPKEGLDELGIDPDDLLDKEVPARLSEDGEYTIKLNG